MENSNKFLKKAFNVNIRKNGFTLIELLTVVGIIAMLIGLLLPALAAVRTSVKRTQQGAQFSTIGMALEAFRNDFGYYPESQELFEWNYEGAQRLSEGLVGWDLTGFDEDSNWNADGRDDTGIEVYPINPTAQDLEGRSGPYLDEATKNVFRLGASSDGSDDGLYYPSDIPPPLAEDNEGVYTAYNTHVICDVYGVRKIEIYNQARTEIVETVQAGTPILYFKANTASQIMDPTDTRNSIYDVLDNRFFYNLPALADIDEPIQRRHIIEGNTAMFYNAGTQPYDTYHVIDPRVTTTLWPHNPDSYILISAGEDGLYGTRDDITNF